MTAVSAGRESGVESRWMGVGRSLSEDSRRAGVEAVTGALRRDDVKLLIVFAAVTHDPAALLEGIAEAAPGIPVIGCSARGEIAPDGPRDDSVVVTAIGGEGLSVSTAVADGITGRQREAGAEVAQCAASVEDLPYRVLMLLTDGLASDQESVLRGAYGVVGASVPLFGGCASPDADLRQSYQLHGDQVVWNGVVAAAIASDTPLGIGVSHGWRKAGEAMIVTRSDRTRVYTLDDEPALDAYLGRLGAPAEVYDDPAVFSQWTLTRPLGIQRRSGVAAKGVAHAADFEGRSIGGGTDISPGALTWAMEGDSETVLGATEVACQAAVDALGDRPLVGMLALSCIARRAVLGDEGIQQESARIAGRASGAPYAGFYSWGEIARTRGIDGFHNHTLVVLALS